ncbi:MAG: hypothetical protein WEB93_01285 [Sphingomonadales bacterium]
MRSSDCRLLENHQPDADVTYQPGVDVRGRPVAPADVEAYPEWDGVARNVTFAVVLDLEDRIGAGEEGQDRPVTGEGVLGFVDVRDGVVTFNGQSLTPPAINAVSEACRAVQPGHEKKR